MDTLMTTLPAVGATGGRPREPLNLGHRTKWRGLILPDPWLPGVEAMHPHRATAGRPYRWSPCVNTAKRVLVRAATRYGLLISGTGHRFIFGGEPCVLPARRCR